MEQLYYNVFNYSYDGLCVFDIEGKGVAINKAAERITGYDSQEFFESNIYHLLEEGIISNSVFLKVLKEKRTVTDVVSIRGNEVLITGSPILNDDGKIEYVVENIRDISQLNNLKMDLLLSIALKKKKKPKSSDKDNQLPKHMVPDGVVAESKKMNKIIHLVNKIAKVDSTVLLLGESGVGKEVIVKLIHRLSLRSDNPLIKINCAAIPHHLLESELFGYERGAFTGADERGRPGLFEEANGGTIFLDEIGDMPLDLQVKLLRVLQEFEIRRVGGRKNIKVDVRVVSATNKNLGKLVQKGKFREDLFYRLNIVPIHIPPLRERVDDIAPLAHMFLNRANQKYQLNKHFQPGVIELLERYSWPGNIREMENIIERLVVTSGHDEISWSELPFISEHSDITESLSLKKILQEVEKEIILEKMETYKTTRKAAKALGISQSSLVNKLKKYR
ncbi:sigma-54 interaction domain-containing protein [Pueribacillus theae]|uniref:sigma-54 interaction domain-containing protein n=1 Tax=Pueribacillus theae TaxID=2171751 RepID=UPI0023E8C35C|nr:sigma 54-interacting transcriptional regulator [Pueribacillus theae]